METNLKVARFKAFNSIHERVFLNKTDDEIMDELERICSSGIIVKIDTYEAKLVGTMELNKLVDKGQREKNREEKNKTE